MSHAFSLEHAHFNGEQASETDRCLDHTGELICVFGKQCHQMYSLSSPKVNVAERTCCCLFCKCFGGDGTVGDPGPPGKKVILKCMAHFI